MSAQVPSHIREQLIPRVYADAARLHWLHLSSTDRSRQYTAWLDDPAVGGILIPIMGRDGARVWLKDGPLKEYSRALAGVGTNARYISSRSISSAEIVTAVLGGQWRLVEGSAGIKPMHCVVEREEQRRYMAWGSSKDFKHLVWACLKTLDQNRAEEAIAVVIETLLRPTPTGERAMHARIARRCDIAVTHLQISG